MSSQFIDLEAQLNSAQRREQSLLSLLEKAVKLNDILTLEQQLNRVRTEIERLQGQLNFLDRRVELATINVFLFPRLWPSRSHLPAPWQLSRPT